VYKSTQLPLYLYINILAMAGFSFILKGVPCRIDASPAFETRNGYGATPKRVPLTLECTWRECSRGNGDLDNPILLWPTMSVLGGCRTPRSSTIRVGNMKYHHARRWEEGVMVTVYMKHG
jgi:hypothetical protein